jgi:GMP reductase
MRIEDDVKLDYCDVLLRPKRSTLSSRNEVCLKRSFIFRNGSSWHGIPIVAANMDTIGTIDMAEAMCEYNMLTCLSKQIIMKERDYDTKFLNSISFTMGMDGSSKEKVFNLLDCPVFKNRVHFITLDVANGYMECFIELVKDIRKQWKNKIIIAGNVVTAEMTEALILAGADIVKVGIGPGSVCTTRKLTGVGYPQLSAVIECADAAHGLGGHIMADGGCTSVGDIVKAFGAGADFVMIGGMLAGHDESAGELLTTPTGKYKSFYGMSSDTAMKKYNGGVAEYRASEGKTVLVPYRGTVCNTILEILGGIRSACSYVGAEMIKDLPKCATFIRVNNQLNVVYGNEDQSLFIKSLTSTKSCDTIC